MHLGRTDNFIARGRGAARRVLIFPYATLACTCSRSIGPAAVVAPAGGCGEGQKWASLLPVCFPFSAGNALAAGNVSDIKPLRALDHQCARLVPFVSARARGRARGDAAIVHAASDPRARARRAPEN